MSEWLFQPLEDLLPEQREEWLSSFHMEAQFDMLLRDPNQSVVVLTNPGCGFSTSITLLPERQLLTFPYDLRRWPGCPDAFTEATTHFGQWMGRVAQNFIDHLRERPETAQQLKAYQYEFLVWFVRSHLGRWQALSLLNFLEQHLPAFPWAPLREACEQDRMRVIFAATGSGILGQISEALDVAALLGWQGIYACTEISFGEWVAQSADEQARLRSELSSMLSTLAPLTRNGFGLKLGLPNVMIEPREARLLTRDRAKVAVSYWHEEHLQQLTLRLLCRATGDLPTAWEELVAQVYRQAHETVQAIYGAPGPAAAMTIASLLLDQPQLRRALPDGEHVRRELFARSARLRLDGDSASRRIWRGAEAIQLSETLYSFFVLLWKHRGGYVSMDALISHSGTKSNVDQTLTRLRRAIEPSVKEPIYLQRDSSGPRLVRERCEFQV